MADITVGASYSVDHACSGRAVVVQSVSKGGGSGKVAGSGAARFGGVKGLPEGSYKDILTVPGVGKIQANCTKGTLIRFKNTTDRTLQVTAAGHGGVDFQHDSLTGRAGGPACPNR